SPYIHYIVERLEERDMPLELALLPIIESSYDPFAYSPAHAVGLWQFIPSTGRQFNLRQTNWYDGRRDITASTNAALRYLSYLHGLFNG
ncbi:transglycosylase SLT domain-containing protein, partial [Pseudomonas sp. 65/3-MNA-CIBAN-0223]|uniref:transglycosylase SLT domain-containing protein n=1 Tax=Pseudomonas sp. 65/3-MNA-CIBAN-0223 TaxID=3140476 RepID=UPI00332F0A0F